jgi:hypothetical protein
MFKTWGSQWRADTSSSSTSLTFFLSNTRKPWKSFKAPRVSNPKSRIGTKINETKFKLTCFCLLITNPKSDFTFEVLKLRFERIKWRTQKCKNGRTSNSLEYAKLINREALLYVQKCKSHEYYLLWSSNWLDGFTLFLVMV